MNVEAKERQTVSTQAVHCLYIQQRRVEPNASIADIAGFDHQITHDFMLNADTPLRDPRWPGIGMVHTEGRFRRQKPAVAARDPAWIEDGPYNFCVPIRITFVERVSALKSQRQRSEPKARTIDAIEITHAVFVARGRLHHVIVHAEAGAKHSLGKN